ncbi:hypothetical protein N9F58_01830 [Akkermansiaceae bacterium]|nr:hypothetical protein [Akkermansiaceae bacterium]
MTPENGQRVNIKGKAGLLLDREGVRRETMGLPRLNRFEHHESHILPHSGRRPRILRTKLKPPRSADQVRLPYLITTSSR